MKICYLCSDLGIPLTGIKGASAHVRGFVRAIKSLGHDIVVVTSSANGDAGLNIPVFSIPQSELFENPLVQENPRILRALNHTCNNIMTEKILLEIISNFQPDLIYERYSPFAVAGSFVAKKKGIFHTLEVNSLLATEGKLYRKQALQEISELFEQAAFNTTSLIVTVSEKLREIVTKIGISEKKVITIANGVDEIFFAPYDFSVREKFEDKVVIGFVGSLKPWHGIDILVDSFRKIAEDPVYHLLVVGDGPMRKRFYELEQKFPERVTFMGGIGHNDIPKYIDAMDICVAPYPKLENFYFSPLKVYEYMARGKAIIASDIGQISKLIQHGKTGWLVPAGDASSVIKAVKRLSRNQTLRKKLGEKAFEDVLKNHTWKHRAAYFLNFIKEGLTKGETLVAKEIKT